MKRIYKCLSFFLAFVLNLALVSCVNEIFDNGPEDLDGECNVSFELQGLPLQSALTRTAGNAIREVGNLYILFYTKGSAANEADYKLAYAFTTDKECHNDVFSKDHYLEVTSKDDLDRTSGTAFDPGDGEWKGVAESTTKHVKTSEVQVKRGDYAVYVVANVPQFSSAAFSKEDVATVGDLRNYQLTWNADNIAANNAMFGFFTADAQEYDVINKAAPLIKITSKAITLHAWVKRAVSKVTVAFDGRNLYSGVRVYIKNVKICDIPANCKLGKDNIPVSKDELIEKGEQITYLKEGEEITDLVRISKEEPFFPDFREGWLAEDPDRVAEWRGIVHAENSKRTLYFFENLQGKGEYTDGDIKGTYKPQTDDIVTGVPDDFTHQVEKDNKPFGTYIEVEAYYQNDNFGTQSEGSIIYRFMLGKNITDDFNAERNNHYKLTLCFNKNANDVDWHIDYSEKIDDYTPKTIYVSYEYNTPSLLPVHFVLEGEKKVTDLSVKITVNNWFPDVNTIDYYKGAVEPGGLSTGFLALRYDSKARVDNAEKDDAAVQMVENYWNESEENHTRQYIKNGNKVIHSDLGDDSGYKVHTRTNSEGNTVFEAQIPLFTRPLIINKWASWSGANPYYTSTRSAKVSLTGTVGGVPYEKTIDVIQVPRIENPSGIYRMSSNDDEFDVTCMIRTSGEMWKTNSVNGNIVTEEPDVSFKEFNSFGAWRAIIYRSSKGDGTPENWFTLTKGAQKADAVGEYIQGDPNTSIKFKYKPKGTIGRNDVRCGVIKVEYNDYTCTHYILVRQGYAPMQLEAGKVYWHTFNLYSGSAEVTHPCDAGSFFIRGHLVPAILDSNTEPFGKSVNTLSALTNVAGTTSGKVNIPILDTGDTKRSNFPTADISLSNNNATYNNWSTGRVPSIEDWSFLKDANSSVQIDKAFGVLYGDGATETQTNPDEVWGCLHADVNTTTGLVSKGMRGAFVYNERDGRNIFLPIGASGFGRRKVGAGGNGILMYSYGDDANLLNFKITTSRRALLRNLNTNEGAIYWAHSRVNEITDYGGKDANSWDINYKTFDFDYMDATQNGTPACYIRLVQDGPPQ